MPRQLRLAAAVALVSMAATINAGSASASTASADAVVATHGLGARVPSARLSPQTARAANLAVLPASVDLRKWAVTPNAGERHPRALHPR